jgi:hypothetical protein
MNAAIIGTSKIAQIHLREFCKKKFNKIFIVTRNIKKSKKMILKFDKTKNNIIPFSLNDLSSLNCKYYSICSPTKIHDNQIEILKKRKNSIIIVEKPFISFLKFKKKFEKRLNELKSFNLSFYVNYPMYYLADSFIKKFKFNEEIRSLNVYYQTSGQNTHKEIAEDLLPHALAFLYRFFEKDINKLNFKNHKISMSKNHWNCKIEFNNLNFNIYFKEDPNKKTSNFYFEVNKKKFIRIFKKEKNNMNNFIKYKKTLNFIQNPMNVSLNFALNCHKKIKPLLINEKINEFNNNMTKKIL